MELMYGGGAGCPAELDAWEAPGQQEAGAFEAQRLAY